MAKKGNSGSNFLIGAFVIAVSHILVKVIGAIYKIPLDGLILKTEGMGIYSSSYTIYNWLFVVSTAGLPVAISKMVAEARALGRMKESEKIFRISKILLFCVGLCAFLIMFLFAVPFSKLIQAPSSYLTMMVMAPSLFFVAMASSYRGYYQGQENMFPTALSEVIEALCKLIFGLSFAYYAMKIYNEPYIGSAGAIAGITMGTVFSFLFLIIYHRRKKEVYKISTFDDTVSSAKSILKRLIKLAVPVTLGVSVFTLTSLIDTAMVMNQLYGLGYTEAERLSMFGYLNRAITLFNLPPTVIASIAISIVPAIAAAIAVKDDQAAGRNVKSALRITVLIAMPCAAGLSSLAKPILSLLYNDGNYSFLLNVMGIATLFVTVVQVSNAMLQAYSRPWIPVRNMLIGGIVKVVVNLLLVSRPEININGAPIGTTLCYFTVMSLNIISIKKYTGIKFGITGFVVKPLILGIVTALSAFYSYKAFAIFAGNLISTAGAICVAVVCYGVCMLAIKAIDKDDVRLLPKGEKILKILERYKLI